MSRVDRESINVGMIGRGTVAEGVIDCFRQGRFDRYGIVLKMVAVRNPSKSRDVELPDSAKQTTDASFIIEDPSINIVVELMGGTEKAREYTYEALKRDKHVVTANKALLGEDLPELFDLAREREVSLNFEASVCGTIPVIQTIREYLLLQKIKRIRGIFNGTTNYILTKMEDNVDFHLALKEAQGMGVAEENHILDTGGFDTRSKLAILASLASGTHIQPESIPCRGITEVTLADIAFAREFEGGYAIKLLASAEQHDGTWSIEVGPKLISKNHLLALVSGVTNAVTIDGDLSGPLTLSGAGASRYPTAAAVIADISHAAHHVRYHIPDFLPELKRQASITKPEDISSTGYIRTELLDRKRTFGRIGMLLADSNLSMSSILQRESPHDINGVPYTQDIITLHRASQSEIDAGLANLAKSRKVRGKPFYMSFAE